MYIGSVGTGPTIDDVKFIGCRILNNYLQGVNLSYSASNNIGFLGCTIAGNSTLVSNAYYGVDVVANTSNFIIDNCIIGTAGTATNTQKGAINIPTGTSNFTIKGNTVINNQTAPYITLGTLTGSINIENNIGDISNGLAETAIASSAATSGTTETLLCNAKIQANSVRIGQTFRISGVGTSSSTGTLLFKVRVGANGTTADNLAWTSITSSAQVANARAGFYLLGTVRSLTTFNCDGMSYASASFINSSIAPAVATIAASSAWFIDVTGTCSTGTFTLQECAIEAL